MRLCEENVLSSQFVSICTYVMRAILVRIVNDSNPLNLSIDDSHSQCNIVIIIYYNTIVIMAA